MSTRPMKRSVHSGCSIAFCKRSMKVDRSITPAQVVKISLDPELALVLLVLVKKQERGDPLSLHDMKKLGSRERHKLVGQHGQSGKD